MDFMELAKRRCSVRAYEDRKVEPEKLERILEAARLHVRWRPPCPSSAESISPCSCGTSRTVPGGTWPSSVCSPGRRPRC